MTILDEIVLYKKSLLEGGYYHKKLNTLKGQNIRNTSTLESTLKMSKQLAIIAEIKSKSPTVDNLPTRNLTQQVKAYEAYGADAISILTDERYFEGSFERLQLLAQETTLPILCKDFMIHPLQIDVAKKAGANIILLIVNILTDEALRQLYQYATSLDLEVIVEVHDNEELERAHRLHPKIIGVNNRDLKHFVTDVKHTNTILHHKQQGTYYISESGIHTKADVESIVSSGIDGLLIGEALMRCDDLSQMLPSLKLKKVSTL